MATKAELQKQLDDLKAENAKLRKAVPAKKAVYTRIHSVVDAVLTGIDFADEKAVCAKANEIMVAKGGKAHADVSYAYARVRQVLDAGMVFPAAAKPEADASEPDADATESTEQAS